MQAVYPFIAMVSYNVIIGDTLTKIIGRRVGGECPASISGPLPTPEFLRLSASWLLPSCASTTPTCASTRCNAASLERWALVVHLAVGFAMLASSLFGLIGFAPFATGVQGDILENYCPRDDLINVSRLLFAVTIMLTYPMECFVVREVVENYFFQHPPPLWRHILLTTGIVALAYLGVLTAPPRWLHPAAAVRDAAAERAVLPDAQPADAGHAAFGIVVASLPDCVYRK
uniref:Putative sodium-coupled neutral amino acid transporter 11 n=1 Tax=Macrostomum lignano TaxID=282301 RepID=A0A1I8FFA0_9PLAT